MADNRTDFTRGAQDEREYLIEYLEPHRYHEAYQVRVLAERIIAHLNTRTEEEK